MNSEMEHNKYLKSAQARRKKWILIVVSVIAAIILLPLLMIFIMKQHSEYKLEKMLSDIRKNGYPTNSDEMVVWYKNGNRFLRQGEKAINVPDSENAAVLLNKGFKLFVDDVPDPDYKKTPATESNKGRGIKPTCGNKYEDYYNSKSNSDDEFIDNKDLIDVGTFEDKYFLFTPLPENIVELNNIYLNANSPALEKIEEAVKKPYCRFDLFSKKTFYYPGLSKMRQGQGFSL